MFHSSLFTLICCHLTFFLPPLISSFQGVMSQTTRAHRLCQKAYKQGGQKLQLPLFLAIFKAYLQEGKDIADIDLLSDVAAEVDVMSKEQVASISIRLCILMLELMGHPTFSDKKI